MKLTKEKYKNALAHIVSEIREVVALIMAEGGGKEKEARVRFITQLYEKYHLLFCEENSPLGPLFFLYDALDEYLNNEGARILGAASKQRVMEWYSDLDKNVKEITANIEALKT